MCLVDALQVELLLAQHSDQCGGIVNQAMRVEELEGARVELKRLQIELQAKLEEMEALVAQLNAQEPADGDNGAHRERRITQLERRITQLEKQHYEDQKLLGEQSKELEDLKAQLAELIGTWKQYI